jgi:L-lactate dehydrogenase complex protein LldG
MTRAASTTSTARQSIIGSIRRSLAESALIDKVHGLNRVQTIEAFERSRPSIAGQILIDNFRKNLESVGGDCQIVRSVSEAADAIRATIEKLAAARIAISDSPLVASLVKGFSGVEIVENADREFLFGSDVGITSAQWAIAETGTLVLESRSERHRLTSLVPPVHICVLKASSIRQSLGEILELVHEDLSSVVTFVTGASRTSDIELTLAIGVHGPKELHVIIVSDHQV